MKAFIGIVAAVVILFPLSLSGQMVLTEYTGTSIPTGPPSEWGTIKCAGGEILAWPPVGPPQPPCSEGTERILLRGMVQEYAMITTDSRMIGRELVTSNVNADGWTPFGPGSGHIWGAVRIFVTSEGVDTGEVWEGTWTGTRTVTETTATSVMHAVVHGSGERIEGLTARYNIVIDFVASDLQLNGVILEPGGTNKGGAARR